MVSFGLPPLRSDVTLFVIQKKKKGDMPLHHLNSKNYSVVLLSVETDKTSYVGERAGGPPT